ncbi:MAG: hypothetical protein KC502_00950 [Myxococcales bacterium]|nr:hypothetical protein [Myxococcales bacterium]
MAESTPTVSADDTPRIWRVRARALANFAVWLYLASAVCTTVITWKLRFEDWYLYALMNLCTAIVVANYARLGLRRTWVRRTSSLLFSTVVILAWTALLFEKTQVGWTVVDDVAVDLGAQPLFWLPVSLGLATVALLFTHLFIAMPRARREAGL